MINKIKSFLMYFAALTIVLMFSFLLKFAKPKPAKETSFQKSFLSIGNGFLKGFRCFMTPRHTQAGK